jgi:hypothetical protein
MFNTLMYAKKLEDAGVSREQAEAHIQIMAEIVEGDMATKEDLNQVKNELKGDIRELKIEMNHLENRLIIKLGTIVTVALAAFATAVKFL